MAPQLILATGVTGFLGFRALAFALEKGYRVRGVIRRAEQAEKIKAAPSVKAHLDRLEFAVVPSILVDGAYDEALKDVDYVLHIASPLAEKAVNFEVDLIQPALLGTMNMLKASSKVPTVKRVVITSSVVAQMTWEELFSVESPKTFNEHSTTPDPTGPYSVNFEAYSASKVIAFNAARKFVATEKPHFDVIHIHPGFIIGKNELITDKEYFVDGTNAVAFKIVLGDKNPVPLPGSTVHVNDVAKVHVLALDPKVPGNQSFETTSQGVEGTRWEEAIDIVKKHFPEYVKSGLLPANGVQPSKKVRVDSTHTENTFGFKFLTYEDQVKSLTQHYVELNAKA